MIETEVATRFVLREVVASDRQGRDVWFRQMTDLGPMTTANAAERAEFHTRQAAQQCPAMWHPIACFVVEEVGGEE